MKRILSSVVVLCAVSAFAADDFKEGYYDLMDGTSKEELKAAAKESVKNHLTLKYGNLPNYWIDTDVYPDLVENAEGQMCKRWWDMYSPEVYLILPGQTGYEGFSGNKMQREHVVPKSWWKVNNDVEYTPAYSDMWNLFPSDGPANNAKNNWPLGETQSASFDNGVTKVGVPVEGCGGGVGTVFEPADEYKGDFARVYFYVATVYDDLAWTNSRNSVYVKNSWPTLRDWAVEMLLDWARRDPVSEKEINRNNAVEEKQGNRNPYVDFPELAEFVWGKRMDQTFYISEQEDLDPTRPDDAVVDFIEVDESGWIGINQAGFSIITSKAAEVTVFDMSGRCILKIQNPAAGTSYTLPGGIYIITSPGHRPMKIISSN